MSDTLLAPDAPFRLSAPIEHITKLDDGTVLAHVTVTSETPDSQGEIVDYDAFKAAAPELMKWAVLGEMHDPDRQDAGTILKLYFDDAARRVEADIHVVDPVAVKKVVNRVYKMVSIGGIKLASTLVQIGGRTFRKITRLLADELSLVPRGANPDAAIAKRYVLAKMEEDMGAPLTAAQSSGSLTLNFKNAGTVVPGSPLILAGEPVTAQQAAIDETRVALAKRDIPQSERDEMANSDFAGKDGSFPIKEPGDVAAAASSIGRAGPDNYSTDELKSNIIRIARRKGPAFVAQLPEAWKDGKMAKDAAAPAAEKAKKVKKTKVAPTAQELAERKLLKDAVRLRKLRKARAALVKADAKLAKNDALKAGQKAQQAVAEAMAEEQKEQAEGSDESEDLDNLKDADEALHAFNDAESKEPEEDVAKRYKALRKRARLTRGIRKATAVVKREERRIAKVGKRNSSADGEQHDVIHGALVKLGYSKCMTKTAEAQQPMAPAEAATDTDHTEAPIAKSDLMRETLQSLIPTSALEAIMARVTAIDEKTTAQGDQLAKIARQPTGGGPAASYAPVFRGEPATEVVDRGTALAKAASVLTDRDDPRLREALGTAASLEAIKAARGG